MSSFKNQVAVVTGASSGIGRAIALGLATKDASLCLVGRNVAALKEVAEEAAANGSRVKSYRIDLSRDNDIQELKLSIEKDFRHINLLVHSAGAFSMGLIESSPVADFDLQYRVNLRAPYLLTQLLLPMMNAQDGQIVFINSSVGLKSKALVSQYAATKHALRALADSLREEVNAKGIRVLSIYPGRTATPMQETVHKMEGKAYGPDHFMQPEDLAEVVISSLLLPRSAEVTDVSIRPMKK